MVGWVLLVGSGYWVELNFYLKNQSVEEVTWDVGMSFGGGFLERKSVKI